MEVGWIRGCFEIGRTRCRSVGKFQTTLLLHVLAEKGADVGGLSLSLELWWIVTGFEVSCFTRSEKRRLDCTQRVRPIPFSRLLSTTHTHSLTLSTEIDTIHQFMIPIYSISSSSNYSMDPSQIPTSPLPLPPKHPHSLRPATRFLPLSFNPGVDSATPTPQLV